MDDDLDLSALAPRVDEGAARAVFDRRRAARRRRRRVVTALGVSVVAVAGVLGGLALVDDDDVEPVDVVGDGTTTSTTALPVDQSACAELRISGPVPDGFSASLAADGELTDGAGRSIEVQHGTTPDLGTGTSSGPAGWERRTGPLEGGPAVELQIGWYGNDCWLRLLGRGVSAEELAAFVDGSYLLGPERAPLLDPRGAVWPETAQSQLFGPLGDDRLSMTGVAYSFANEVLGWDDVVETPAPDAETEPAHDGRCEATVYVRRASDPARGVAINLSRGVGGRWWSVCRVASGPPPLVESRGTTVVVAAPADLPEGTASLQVRIDHAGEVALAEPGTPSELPAPPATTGSVVALYRGADSEVIAAWGEPVPAGDVTIGEGTPSPPTGTHPVVIGRDGVLGWWDGATWHEIVADRAVVTGEPVEGLPYEEGAEVTVVRRDGTTRSAMAGAAGTAEFCGAPDVALDPDLGEGDAVAVVGATWDVVPRAMDELALSDVYVEALAELLGRVGLEGEPVGLERVLRVDLEGDGVDEVLLEATHPDYVRGVAEDEGWYSLVAIRRLVEGRVQTDTLLLSTPPPDAGGPVMDTYDVAAAADLSGDGVLELVVDHDGFEWSGTDVFATDVTIGRVLLNGCGV